MGQSGHHAQGARGDAHCWRRNSPHRISAGTFTELPDRDGYAPQVGFIDSFPAARDPAAGRAWLAHCYGAVGVGRDNAPDTGNGAELYAVIGHAPRWLDQNVTVVGRIRQGIELLATLPRGTEALGYYAKPAQNVPISRVTMASDLPGQSAHAPSGAAHRFADLCGRGRGAPQPQG